MIHRFGLREGSGGKGKFNGGDGVVREIEFTEPLQVSILSEVMIFLMLYHRRVLADRISVGELCSDGQGSRMGSKGVSLAHSGATLG